MAQIIDIALWGDVRNLLETTIERHGIAWFLARDGTRLMALEDAKVELLLATVVANRRRRRERVIKSALEYCRRQLRRALIRKIAQAMVASGC